MADRDMKTGRGRRRAPAWLWPALISVTLALAAFFLVIILVPSMSDSFITGSIRPALSTDSVTEPLVTRPHTETTGRTEPTTAATVTEPAVTETEPLPTETEATEVSRTDPLGSPATLLIRRAVDKVRESILTLYVSIPERPGQPGRAAMFSGVVIDADGYFVTPTSNLSFALTYNGRLHEQALAFAYLADGTKPYPIEMIAHDRNTDVALLRILDAPALRPAAFAAEPRLELGDLLIVLGGSDLDLQDLSLSVGYLTGLERRSYFENGLETGMIQTSAFVTPIMSGAALLDPAGQMVGLINSNVSRSYSDLHGYALPVGVLREVIDGLRNVSPPTLARRVWLGVRTMDEAEYAELAAERDYPPGLMVAEVLDSGPAAASDLMRHDIIVTVDGVPVSSLAQLNLALDKRLVGERVMITLYRPETRRYLTTYVYLREPER